MKFILSGVILTIAIAGLSVAVNLQSRYSVERQPTRKTRPLRDPRAPRVARMPARC